ncbi:hypothetical protein AHiyo4_30820 [Arthrobacter sp. Hiyo4]|nr:hypothetical protein AHiyo4_30820 [Arthrobacter sp. Hiyo4]
MTRSSESSIAADSGEYAAHSAKTTGTWAESSTSSWKLPSVTVTRSGAAPSSGVTHRLLHWHLYPGNRRIAGSRRRRLALFQG